MAKYNSSPFGNISGEVLGVVASSNKGVKFLRNKGKTADAKTEKQLARRAIYGEFCTVWDDLNFYDFGAAPANVKEKFFDFKSFLSGCLSLNQSPTLMEIIPKWKNATLPAPQLWKTSDITELPCGLRFNCQLFFPAVSNDTDFVSIATRIGSDPYAVYDGVFKVVFAPWNEALKQVENRANTCGYKISNDTDPMVTCKLHAYMNKKTGQISKPLILFADQSMAISAYYPFGK